MGLKDFSLDGKTVLITGASSGIGRAAAIQASEHGAKLIISGRNEKRLSETAELLFHQELGHSIIRADFNEVSDVIEFASQLKQPLDGVVHSAGVSKLSPVRMLPYEQIRTVQFINFEAPVVLTQQLLFKRLIRDGGSLVFMGSIAPFLGIKGNGCYASSKAALMAMAQNLASEVAAKGIRSNSLAPAMVVSPMTINPENPISDEQIAKYQSSYPLGWGRVDDVANAIIFFLSDASRWVTGTTFKMDGGLTLS